MKKILLAKALILWAGMASAQQMVKGTVFEDLNNNGKKERREKGIPGVAVSNGAQVVLTDLKGSYKLALGNDNIIFVVKPSGYRPRVTEKNQPLFYHYHKPQGSPADFKYKGVAPTGKLPSAVDFALVQNSEQEEFSVLVFGDPQPYNLQEIEYFSRGIVEEVRGIQGMAFGLSLGDLVGDDLSLHSPYIDAVQKVGIPWYNVMGNHDMNYDAKADSLSDESFEASFGPANYSFNYGNAHFIILDDILYPDPRDGKGYWGGFRKDQMEFIANDLKHVPNDRLVVLAFHIPIKNMHGDFRAEDRQQLFDLLKDYPNTLSMSAHTHLQRNDIYTSEDGWKGSRPHHEYNAGTTSGDWYSGELNEQGVPASTMRDGTPKGYAFLHVKGNQYTIDYKVAGKPADYQMEIFAPNFIPSKRGTSARIYANFFMGRKDSQVEYRIDQGQWKPMNYVEDADPSFLTKMFEWDLSDTLKNGRRPSHPEKSTHLWQVTFPRNLGKGEHLIEVRAKDLFGRIHTGTRKFRVE